MLWNRLIEASRRPSRELNVLSRGEKTLCELPELFPDHRRHCSMKITDPIPTSSEKSKIVSNVPATAVLPLSLALSPKRRTMCRWLSRRLVGEKKNSLEKPFEHPTMIADHSLSVPERNKVDFCRRFAKLVYGTLHRALQTNPSRGGEMRRACHPTSRQHN